MIAELVREREIAPGDNDGPPNMTGADVDRIAVQQRRTEGDV